jgi:hypothetical protein
MKRSALLRLLGLLGLLCLPAAAAAAVHLEGAQTLRPLTVDLRRLYPKLEGRWRGIDASDYMRFGSGYRPATIFLAAPDEGGEASAVTETASAALPQAANGVFTLRRGEVDLQQRLLGASSASALREHGLLRYPNAYPHTEALYVADGASVQRYFLLSDPKAPTRFTTAVRLRGGRLAEDPGRGLAVLDDSGAPAIRFAPPRVFDAEGHVRAANWTIHGGRRGRYTVEVGFDPTGLTYPLLVE